MNEITSELHNEVLKKFEPLIWRLAEEGKTPEEITAIYMKHLAACRVNYYGEFRNLNSMQEILNNMTLKADSSAEHLLYNYLQKNSIAFEFQKKIGAYRVDYLVDNYLVVDLDSDLHNPKKDAVRDKYLEKMGYVVLRITINDLVAAPELLIKKIKELQPKERKQKHIRRIKRGVS